MLPQAGQGFLALLFFSQSLSAATYTFSVGNHAAPTAYFVQGQSFTPLIAGNLLDSGPPWSDDGKVRLKRIRFGFDPVVNPPSALYIYDHLPTPEAAASGTSALATGTLSEGVYHFQSPQLEGYKRYFAILPQPANIHDTPNIYRGGADIFVANGEFIEGSFDTQFTATFEAETASPPQAPTSPPPELGLDPFYKKYLDAGGIPVLSSEKVPDLALQVTQAYARRMLSKRRDVVAAMVQSRSRIAVMAESEVTTDIPEHRDLYDVFPGTDWNTRARGLGATLERPASSCAEENVLSYSSDRYRGEDIMIHEFAHGMDLTGLRVADPQWGTRLQQVYQNAINLGRWQNTYAASNKDEYFAEGVQSFFNVNAERDPPDGIHNFVNTREELKEYDPELFQLIREVFPVELTDLEKLSNISVSRPNPGEITLEWTSQPSVVYDLEYSDDFINWTAIRMPYIGKVGSNSIRVTEPLPLTGKRFFRLKVQ